MPREDPLPPPPPGGGGDSKVSEASLIQWVKDVVTGPYEDSVKLKTLENALKK